MRLGFSILFSAYLLISGMGVKIATHYCEGSLAATKVSLTGELASCGMEGCDIDHSTSESTFVSLCCKNHMSSYFLSDFSSSMQLEVSHPVTEVSVLFDIPAFTSDHQKFPTPAWASSKPPPGSDFAAHTSSSSLCTFRI